MSVTDLDARTIADVVDAVRGITPLGRGYVRTYAAGRVEYNLSRREAYSYGRHFPLFRFVPRQGKRAPFFVVNGDRWRGSNSRTNQHQVMTREAIERTNLPSILLPFSALDGAGIEIDSVRPLHVRADRWETVTERRRRLDDVPRWRRSEALLGDDGWYSWTEDRHILGDSLFTAVRDGRRSRYLSSFDTNENPPLYFLCEVPSRGVPQTVEAALDSLAPRAVHAAMLAGKQVERQGDVFFIPTSLDRETLKERGATFGRLTQWTRRAAPKPGEVTYTAPDRDKERRIRSRELAYTHRLWRETFRDSLARATVAHVPDAERREENRRLWSEMTARHEAELAVAIGTDLDSPESSHCDHCGAEIGEPCKPVKGATAGTVVQCRAVMGGYRKPIVDRHRRERDELRRETGNNADRRPLTSCGPVSSRGQRRRWKKLRADRLARIESARADLRRATIAGITPRGYGYGGKPYGYGEIQYRHYLNRGAVKVAREQFEQASAPLADSMGNTCNAHGRDQYRARYGANAVSHWQRAKDTAQRRYRPETVFDTARALRDRETVRRHLMIYGTSHSATEVARVGSAVYVRGTVRHAVDLETGRFGGPDHRPLTLTPDVWYLAIRNTVPRANRRRSRRGSGTTSR